MMMMNRAPPLPPPPPPPPALAPALPRAAGALQPRPLQPRAARRHGQNLGRGAAPHLRGLALPPRAVRALAQVARARRGQVPAVLAVHCPGPGLRVAALLLALAALHSE